jgi:two-component system, chemotaxis family, protein-glutamate methylesterase/glutaminase
VSQLRTASVLPIRVLVVDDSPVQRKLLIALLGADPGLEIVGWAVDGADAIRAAQRLRPRWW